MSLYAANVRTEQTFQQGLQIGSAKDPFCSGCVDIILKVFAWCCGCSAESPEIPPKKYEVLPASNPEISLSNNIAHVVITSVSEQGKHQNA